MGRLNWHLVFLIPDKLPLKCIRFSRGGDRYQGTHTQLQGSKNYTSSVRIPFPLPLAFRRLSVGSDRDLTP